MINKEIFKQVGLTDNESEVYYILLQLKEGSASEIAAKTRISRPHVYDSLNKLLEKGICSYNIRNNKKHFKSLDPNKLIDRLKEREKNLQAVMPELINLFKSAKEKPTVEVLEGGEGIKTILNEIIKTEKEMLAFNTLGKEFYKYVPDFFIERYLNERLKKHIKSRQFYTEGAQIINHPMVTYKKIPREYSQVTLFVYGNNVVMFILVDPIMVIRIKSKEVARLYRNQFELLWKLAKK